MSHLEHNWSAPRFRAFFSALEERHMVVRYDCRGTGLSCDRPSLTLGDEVANLAAVVDHVGLSRFALFGRGCGAPAAVSFADTTASRRRCGACT